MPTPPTADARLLDELLALALAAARAGAAEAHARYSRPRDVRLKRDASEVSDADEAAQAAIVAAIRARRPADGLITEERLDLADPPPPPTGDRPCWVIDPIDGTRNYIRRMGDYCTSGGVMLAGRPVVGVIIDARHDRCYAAQAGGPLLVDGAPWRPDERDGHSDSLVVGIPSTATGPVYELTHAWLDRHVIRNYGSTAIHLALVATGQLDAAVSTNSKLWDIAAGWLLVEAGGGRISAPGGGALPPLAVATYRSEQIPTLAVGPTARAGLGAPTRST